MSIVEDGDLIFDIVSVDATVTVTADGAPAEDPAFLMLRDAEGRLMSFFNTEPVFHTSTLPLAPGSYEAYFFSVGVLQAQQHLLGSVTLTDGAEEVFDVDTVAVFGTLTVNGQRATPPSESGRSAELLTFASVDSSTHFSLLVGSDGSFPVSNPELRVIAGTYEMLFRNAGGNRSASPGMQSLPRNGRTRFATVDLTTDQSVALDVPATPIGGSIHVDGEPARSAGTLAFEALDPPSRPFDTSLHVYEYDPRALVPYDPAFGTVAPGSTLIPGRYRVTYEQTQSESAPLLANERVKLGCWTVEEPDCDPRCCVPFTQGPLVPEGSVEVLVLLDTSASMHQAWPWVRAGLAQILSELDSSVSLGLALFPIPGLFGTCSVFDDAPILPVAPNNNGTLQSVLDMFASGHFAGPSPLTAILDATRRSFQRTPSGATRRILLVTDGAPFCPGSSRSSAIREVEALRAAGIETLVMSYGHSSELAALGALAEAGGLPAAGSQPVYLIDAAASQGAAVAALKPPASCDFALPRSISMSDGLSITVDGNPIARGSAGWDYAGNSDASIVVHGATCERILAGDAVEVAAAVSCL